MEEPNSTQHDPLLFLLSISADCCPTLIAKEKIHLKDEIYQDLHC